MFDVNFRWLVSVDCKGITPHPQDRAEKGRSIPSAPLGIKLRRYWSQFQLANCSRRAIFLNLPTLVRGISGRKTKASGSCHLAKDLLRNSRSSSGVAGGASLWAHA